jgi:hypothetical protein
MFKFLIFAFLIFLLMVFLLGFSFVRTLARVLFGIGAGRRNETNRRQSGNRQSSKKHRKVFNNSDGEYVDYEEIKD